MESRGEVKLKYEQQEYQWGIALSCNEKQGDSVQAFRRCLPSLLVWRRRGSAGLDGYYHYIDNIYVKLIQPSQSYPCSVTPFTR